MSKHFIRIQSKVLDLISEDDTMTCIRHIPTNFNLDLFEVEISEAVFQAIMDGSYTIDCNPTLDWVMVNGETAFPTSKSFRFIPRFVVSLPLETLRVLKVAGAEESWVRLYSYKMSLWTEPGTWGTKSEIALDKQIGNFGFVIPPFEIGNIEVTNIEIYICNNGYYLHLQTTSSEDTYIRITEISEIV